MSSGPPEPFHLSQLGNARRLVHRHGDRIRHVRAWGKWFVYGAGVWRADDTGELFRLAKDTVAAIYAEAAELPDSAERKALVKWALQSESESQLSAMIGLAASEPTIALRPADFDTDPLLFNVENGTLDLSIGGTRRAADPGDLLTKQSPVEWDERAPAPRWHTFLKRTTGGDEELIRFLQIAAGYSLTGYTGEQVLFLLHGLGANGKSTFLQVLSHVLGDYAARAEFSSFMAARNDTIRNDIARLKGARFVSASESGEGRRLDEATIKNLTGGDTVTARFLHQEYFEFLPEFKLWLAANHKPVIRGTDHAIWRRVLLVPFTATIPPAEQDPGLAQYLIDAEASGILRWAVEGCGLWRRERLPRPTAVQAATQQYQVESDVLAAFLEECCELDASGRVGAAALYEAYRSWCQRSGEHTATQTTFGRRLSDRGLQKSKDGRVVWRLGLRLRDGSDSSDSFPGFSHARENHKKNTGELSQLSETVSAGVNSPALDLGGPLS